MTKREEAYEAITRKLCAALAEGIAAAIVRATEPIDSEIELVKERLERLINITESIVYSGQMRAARAVASAVDPMPPMVPPTEKQVASARRTVRHKAKATKKKRGRK